MVEIENNGVLEEFEATVAKEDKVKLIRVVSSKKKSVELEIELHYVGHAPETRHVTIPSSNKLLIEKHLKEIWAEEKPTETEVELPAEIKTAP